MDRMWVNPLRPRHNGYNFADIFKCIFLKKFINFDYNITEFCSQWSNGHYSSIALDNGLAMARWQAIIWTNDGQFADVYMRQWVKDMGSVVWKNRFPQYDICRIQSSWWIIIMTSIFVPIFTTPVIDSRMVRPSRVDFMTYYTNYIQWSHRKPRSGLSDISK